MKHIFILISILLISITFTSCKKNSLNDKKPVYVVNEDLVKRFTPEGSTLVASQPTALILTMDKTFEEAKDFYIKALEDLGAEGEIPDLSEVVTSPDGITTESSVTDENDNIWVYAGAYNDNANSINISLIYTEGLGVNATITYAKLD